MVRGGKLSVRGTPTSVSFLLKVGSDTLPRPLNLKRWKIICDSNCMLCHLRPTTSHILNGARLPCNRAGTPGDMT